MQDLTTPSILPQDCLRIMPYFEGRIKVHPEKNIGKIVSTDGVYERTIIDIIREFVASGYSFMDIGANIGLHTVAGALKKTIETQHFITFEPEKNCFSLLQENCRLNNLDFVENYCQGIGDQIQQLMLNVSSQKEGDHSFLPREQTQPGYHVPVTTLDSFAKTKQLQPNLQLLKIDVEGYEFAVLDGGRHWLKQLSNVALICEVSPYLLKMQSKTTMNILQLLQEIGFTQQIAIVDSETFASIKERRKNYFNILAIKGSHAEQVFAKINPNWFISLEEINLG